MEKVQVFYRLTNCTATVVVLDEDGDRAGSLIVPLYREELANPDCMRELAQDFIAKYFPDVTVSWAREIAQGEDFPQTLE